MYYPGCRSLELKPEKCLQQSEIGLLWEKGSRNLSATYYRTASAQPDRQRPELHPRNVANAALREGITLGYESGQSLASF